MSTARKLLTFLFVVAFLIGVVDNFSLNLAKPVPVIKLSQTQTEKLVETVPDRLTIPDLGIDVSVAKSNIVNGYWEVFNDKAGWGDQSGYPGFAGNQVIFAHARKGLFLNLKQITKGMIVKVYTEEVEYDYKVVDIKSVFPNDLSVIAPTADETLTLYTCTDTNDIKRLVVIAKRVLI